MHPYKDRIFYVLVIAGDILESNRVAYSKQAKL